MFQITHLLESKRNIAGLCLLVALIGITYGIQENSIRIKRLSNFESGMQTCFSRVNQTYTAKMLGDTTSDYLTSNFQNLTEECFAEGILNVEDSFKSELAQVAKKLSTLASNVHWFHEDILSPNSTKTLGGDGESRDVGTRFEKIETTKDEILEASDKYKGELANSLNQSKTFFYLASTLLVLVMFSEYMSTIRRRLSNFAREKEAQAELMDNGGGSSVKVGEIIRLALEQNELVNCSRLFVNYHLEQSLDKNTKNKSKLSLEELVTPIGGKSLSQLNEKIDKIWNDDNIGVSADTISLERTKLVDVNLEQMSSNVIDLVAEKLFSSGIQMSLNIPENLMVSSRVEELEQSLYQLIIFAINSNASGTGEKHISLSAQRLGDIVTFDMIYSGLGIDQDILKQRAGLSDTSKQLDIALQISQTLLEEVQAKIQLDNKLNQNGEVVGGRIKIIFKAATSQAKLVNLEIGSKKEILASINS